MILQNIYLLLQINQDINRQIINQMFKMNLTACIIYCLIVNTILAQDCNSTHLQFFSKYSLGKDDQLNRTFTELQTLSLPNLTYKINEMNSINITGLKNTFKYIDSTQKSEIVGRDTILIVGGKVESTISFNWVRYGLSVPQSGTAVATIKSQEIMFEKQIHSEEGYFDYLLKDYYNITLQFSNFSLTRIQPATITDEDKENLNKILNQQIDNQTKPVKSVLQSKINQQYHTVLENNLINEHFQLLRNFTYDWTNSYEKKNVTINYKMFNTGVTLNEQGLSITYVMRNQNDTKWKCGATVPSQPLSPRIYGGLQEFIQFSVFQNTIRYALQKQYLDTTLNRFNWQSRFFQFFVGDLYEVIPELAQKFTATQKVTGKCQYDPKGEPLIEKTNNNTLNITTQHLCSLYTASEPSPLCQFSITLISEVQPLINSTNLNFKVINSYQKVSYKSYNGLKYSIANQELSNLMIKHSLNRLKQGYIFGSGWKIYPRDYPHVILQKDFLIIYDSTHIEDNEIL